MRIFNSHSNSDSRPTYRADASLSAKKLRNYSALAAAGIFICAGAAAAANQMDNTDKPVRSTKISTQTSATTPTAPSSPAPNSSLSLSIESHSQSTGDHKESSSRSSTTTSPGTVTVNDKTITLPANGTVSRNFVDENGTTNLNASSTSTTTGDSTSSSSLSIDVTSDSNSWRVSEDNP